MTQWVDIEKKQKVTSEKAISRLHSCSPDIDDASKPAVEVLMVAESGSITAVVLISKLAGKRDNTESHFVKVKRLGDSPRFTARSGIFRTPNLKPTLNCAKIALKKSIRARTAFHDTTEAPTWQTWKASKLVGGTLMKYLNSFLALLVAMVGIGCGAGHVNLMSITVSPQSATTTSSPQGQVGYTATGNFANGKSRELSQVDGLSWKTSQTSTGTVAATIGSTGEVTCSAPGTVTITASAPQNLSFTVNNGVQNTSMTVSGSATLTCQ